MSVSVTPEMRVPVVGGPAGVVPAITSMGLTTVYAGALAASGAAGAAATSGAVAASGATAAGVSGFFWQAASDRADAAASASSTVCFTVVSPRTSTADQQRRRCCGKQAKPGGADQV